MIHQPVNSPHCLIRPSGSLNYHNRPRRASLARHSGLQWDSAITLLITYSLTALIFFTLPLSAFSKAPSDSITVKSIQISGNKITRESVIRREILFKEGQRIRRADMPALVEQSRNQLINTALFLTVKLDTAVTAGQLDLYINVAERWYIIPRGTLEFADRNFNEWWRNRDLYRITLSGELTDNNFRGRREFLRGGFSFGWRLGFHLDYRIPYLNKKKTLGLSTGVSTEIGHELGANTINNELQYHRDSLIIYSHQVAGLILSYRRFYLNTHNLFLRFDRFKIGEVITHKLNPDYLGDSLNQEYVIQAGYRYTRNSLDRTFYSHSGSYFSASLRETYFFQSKYGYPTVEGGFRKFFPLHEKMTYMAGVEAEHNFRTSIPYIYRSSLGYRYNVRGYEHYVLDGQSFFLFATELRYRVYKKEFHFNWFPVEQFNKIPVEVHLKLFSDQGEVQYNPVLYNNNLLNHWLAGYGAGVDIVTYYDQICRLEYTYNKLGEHELFFHFIEVF